MRKAVVILPTYNEGGNIKEIIEEIFFVTKPITNLEFHVLIVDSKSKDDTESIVRSLQKKYRNLHLLVTEKEGLGRAYMHGFHYAIDKLDAYLIFEMDADHSHDPKALLEFIHAIEQGADLVVGSRYMRGGSIPKNWGIDRKILSILANLFIRVGFMKFKQTEWTNGYRAIKSWLVKASLDHIRNYSGYVFQVAFLDFAIKQGARVTEIPIHFKERKSGVSKINSFEQIIQTFWYVLSHSSFIKFVLVGMSGFIIDFGLSYFLIEHQRMALWLSTLISTEIAIASNFILNNFWSFSHKKVEHKAQTFLGSFLKFNLVSSGSVIIQSIGVHLAGALFGRKLWYLYKALIIVFVIIPYSYILYNKFVWKDK